MDAVRAGMPAGTPETGKAGPLVITVPWDPARTADNALRRMHWAARGRLHATARETARLCWLQAGSPRAAGKVRVSLTIRRGRKADPLNLLGGCKSIIDGLFVEAITPDDGPEWLELGGVTLELDRQWVGNNAEVVFTVEEVMG